MPQALRISSEILMFDCDGSSPGFSTALAVVAAGGVAAVATWDGASAGFGGSEAQPAATTVDRKTIAATYFMDNSLARRAPGMGRGPGIPRLLDGSVEERPHERVSRTR